MSIVSYTQTGALEAWSPQLFLVGFALELVFALTHGVAYLIGGFAFVDWLSPALLVGRLAVLFGVAGLSGPIARRNARLGTASRALAALAILFTTGLTILAILEGVGITTPVVAVFGIGTVVSTTLTFLLHGCVGLATEAYPTLIGGLLIIATLSVLFTSLGQGAFATDVRGVVGEGVNAFAFLAMRYRLRNDPTAADTAAAAPGTPAE